MKKFFLVIVAVLAWAPATVRAQQVSPTPALQAEGAFSKDWWLKVYAGYDYSMLGDVINGMKAWQGFLQPGGNPTLSIGNSGFADGMEVGFALDSNHTFSLAAENIGTQNESLSYTSGGIANKEIIGPSMQNYTLNFYRTLFRTKDSGTYFFIGGGYYHASVNYSNDSSIPTSQSATFTGGIVGGVLGLTEKVEIVKNLTFGLSVKGRLATFGQVTSSRIMDNGSTQTANAPYALIIFNQLNPGTIGAGSPSFLGSAARYAVVDYSGFTGNLFISYHF
jgi:hypothetical protein